MPDELIRLVGGVKGELIRILAEDSPLSAKKAFNAYHVFGKKTTYQSVHKALGELEILGAVTRNAQGYSLNPAWLSSLSQNLHWLISSQDGKKFAPLTSGSRLNSTFRSIMLFKDLLYQGQLVLSRDEFYLFKNRVGLMPMSQYLDFYTASKKQNPNNIYFSSVKLGQRWFKGIRANGFSSGKLEDEIQFGASTLSIAGWGGMNVEAVDVKAREALVTLDHSPFAAEYLERKGKSRTAVDDLFRGYMAGGWRVILDDPNLACVERKCIARGDKQCVFEIKPKRNFKASDSIARRQLKY
jgi:hypothetical protein